MRRRRLDRREARALDALLVVACLVAGVWRELAYPAGDLRMIDLPAGVYAAVQVLGAMALWWRRTRPAAVAVVQSALNLVSPTQASLVAAYSLGRHSRTRDRAIPSFVALVVSWALGAQLWNLRDMISGPVVLALLFVLGLYVHAQRSLIDALGDRAERAESERALLAERAVADERARIAAELHDVIAHRVSMMVLQAGAMTCSVTGDARRGLDEIGQTGRQALAELREMVELLGDGPADRNDRAGALAEIGLEEVVADARRAGMAVRLERVGDERLLPAATARAVRRLVQESLTNAAKHAPGAPVTVVIEQTTDETTVWVRNPRTDGARLSPGVGAEEATGRGLPGLRERLGLLGGSLRVRQDPGQFELVAEVPATTRPANDVRTAATS